MCVCVSFAAAIRSNESSLPFVKRACLFCKLQQAICQYAKEKSKQEFLCSERLPMWFLQCALL